MKEESVEILRGLKCGGLEEQAAALRRLVSLESRSDGEYCSWLLEWLGLPGTQEAATVRAVIDEFLTSRSCAELVRVSQNCRPSYSYGGMTASGYYRLEPRHLPILLGPPPGSPHLAGFLTFHPSGYVRETAIKHLSAHTGGLPYLLLRLNDWVPEVRRCARDLLAKGESLVTPEQWVDNLPLVYRLLECGRDRHGEFVSHVEARLAQPDALGALEAGCRHPRREVRRLCLPLAMQHTGRPFELLQQALKGDDVRIRFWVMEHFRSHLSDAQQRRALLREALGNHSQVVRQKALREWEQEDPNDLEPFRGALLDRSSGVRQLAQYRLRESDLADFYRRRVAENPLALVGLAECGSSALPEILVFLKHQDRRYRRRAALALTRLPVAEEVWLSLLADADPKISKQARRALAYQSFARSGVERTALRSDYLHARRNALYLLLRKGRNWERLLAAVEALTWEDRRLHNEARRGVSQALRHGKANYVPPAEALQRWQELEPRLKVSLPQEVKTGIVRCLT